MARVLISTLGNARLKEQWVSRCSQSKGFLCSHTSHLVFSAGWLPSGRVAESVEQGSPETSWAALDFGE